MVLSEPKTIQDFIDFIKIRLKIRKLDYLSPIDQEELVNLKKLQQNMFKYKFA